MLWPERQGDAVSADDAVDDLMRRFAALGAAEIGSGPYHPTSPDPGLAATLQDLTSQFPFLTWDEGYYSFLSRYDDAGIYEPARNLMISIVGVTHITSNLLANGYPVASDEGFFEFGDTEFSPGTVRNWKTAVSVAFAFDTTGQRRRAVYKQVIPPGRASEPIPFEWCCQNFVEWLSRVIESNGQVM
jgi:hypothetical protein